MDGIKPGTKSLTTREALDDYVAGFNADDFPRFCAYYAKDVVINIPAIQDKTLEGYVGWIKMLHTRVTEELIPQKVTIDVPGGFVAVDYHVQFRGIGDFKTDNFNDRLGPVDNGVGPLVQMSLKYLLNPDGHIAHLEVGGFSLLKSAFV
ncbi:hypothetical protein ACJ41O_010457 [Fusarium nematophilum]